jgi:hypothetical protein
VKVVELPTSNLQDIPAMVERIAARMRSGDDQTPAKMLWVAQFEDGSITVGALGPCRSVAESIGILELAKSTLVRIHDEIADNRGSA